MMTRQAGFRIFLALGVLVLIGVAATQSMEAIQPALTTAAPANAAYLQSGLSLAIAAAPTAPAPLLGIPTSVMPPAPPSGARCSVDTSGNVCSATAQQQRCSAANDNGNVCSVLPNPSPGGSVRCSAFAQNSACSVLPPSFGANPSQCSTFNMSNFSMQCSAVGTAYRQQCSTKGAGLSQCSAFPNAPAQCSVLNLGSSNRSFCSTKFNQPTVAKGCSAFATATECSVIAGGKGVCTTFGAAALPSCSSFVGPSQCSVIGGAPGNPCVQ